MFWGEENGHLLYVSLSYLFIYLLCIIGYIYWFAGSVDSFMQCNVLPWLQPIQEGAPVLLHTPHAGSEFMNINYNFF